MKTKADRNNIKFRPHFKTHQSAIVGSWFKEIGVSSISVSSVEMAKYFAGNSWKDITIAFPLNVLEMDEINELSKEISLNILIDSLETLRMLKQKNENRIGVYIKIDTGYGRVGIEAGNIEEIENLIKEIEKCNGLLFKGFLTHSGHTYHANSKNEIQTIFSEAKNKMIALKKYFSKLGDFDISVGDTPSCSIVDDFSGIDEIRPGNFTFYDVMQKHLGSCDYEDIAVALACPVVAKYKSRNEIVIYGGGVHLSKEFILLPDGNKLFGEIVKFDKTSWGEPIENIYLNTLSQEHGIIKATPEFIDEIKIGDLIGVLPVHSCLTANLMKDFIILK